MSNPMFQNNDNVEDEVLDEPTSLKDDPEKVRLLSENNKLMAQISNITGNPQVMKILQAAQQGKDVTVVPVDEFIKLQQPVKSEERIDFSTFTPEDTINYTKKLMSSEFKTTLRDTLGEVINPLQQKIETLEGQLKESQAVQINNTIEDAVAKNPDIKNYLLEMRDLSMKHPSMTNLNELYILAKANEGEMPPNVSSGERPTNPPARKKIQRETVDNDKNQKLDITQKLTRMLREHETVKNLKSLV
jgi:hypothetical protein